MKMPLTWQNKKINTILKPLYETFSDFRERYTDPETLQKERDAEVCPKMAAELVEAMGPINIDVSLIGISYPPINKQEWHAAFRNASNTPDTPPFLQKGINDA